MVRVVCVGAVGLDLGLVRVLGVEVELCGTRSPWAWSMDAAAVVQTALVVDALPELGTEGDMVRESRLRERACGVANWGAV